MSDPVNNGDGGGAFPVSYLRDWYAGMAMQGIFASGLAKFIGKEVEASPEPIEAAASIVANTAFKFADAMIEARKKE